MADYPARNPVTAGYLLLVLLARWLVGELSPAHASAVLHAISTNLDNMTRHPVFSLAASALVPAGGLQVVTVPGIVGCLAWLERRFGVGRAFGVFAAGHVLGTLASLAVIVLALRAGGYPDEVRGTLDYGVSYGAIAALTAVSPFLPRRLAVPWAAFGLLYGFTETAWYGALPDFGTFGHASAALTGLVAGLWLARSVRRSRTEEPSVSPRTGLG
ncbi:hypothetical protein GTS_54590 [Gandjariella thermophila]|uniref:Peptidase S54 rhomboid domain-containing protein n=1 Tax=Gandjariella thermophila TaxID=1931992 RepID=A0A4D4JHF8_9PSEU|nr:hypothetical protein GTS_54590 [Gandjariella thermophila]